MELTVLILGVVMLICGFVNILLRWCCDEMQMASWLMFISGIFITIFGYISEPISNLR